MKQLKVLNKHLSTLIIHSYILCVVNDKMHYVYHHQLVDVHDTISVVVHGMMECFLKCVAILLSVFISYSSVELTEFLQSDDEVSRNYGNNAMVHLE